jgi:hypothetical protein
MCCQSGKHRWVHATLGEMDQRMANDIAVDAASSARQCGFGSVRRGGGVSDRSYERGAPYAAKDFIIRHLRTAPVNDNGGAQIGIRAVVLVIRNAIVVAVYCIFAGESGGECSRDRVLRRGENVGSAG